jgi:hypothetical protein
MTIRKEPSYSRRPWPAPPRQRDAELRPPAGHRPVRPEHGPQAAVP